MRTTRLSALLAVLALAAALLLVTAATRAVAAPHPAGIGRYVPLTPVRVLDTRLGGTRLAPKAVRVVDFAPQLPSFVVSAVVLNVTAVDPSAAAFLTVYPANARRPATSSLNHGPGETRANSVTVGLPASATNQKIRVYNDAGTTDLVVDLLGYYVGSTADPAAGSSYYPLSAPIRAWDSRSLGAGGPLAAGQAHEVQRAITFNGQPYRSVTAVAVNLTATNPRGAGFLRAWDGDPQHVPNVSTVNFVAGQTIPNFAIVPARCVNPPSCSTFAFAVDNQVSAATDVIIDIAGVYAAPGQPGATYYTPTTPYRVVDTRTPQGFGRLGPTSTGDASIGTTFGSNPSGANLNVTAVYPTAPTVLAVYASGQPVPAASNLNPVPGEIAPNAAQPLLAPNGMFRVYNNAGSVDVVVDVEGAFRQD